MAGSNANFTLMDFNINIDNLSNNKTVNDEFKNYLIKEENKLRELDKLIKSINKKIPESQTPLTNILNKYKNFYTYIHNIIGLKLEKDIEIIILLDEFFKIFDGIMETLKQKQSSLNMTDLNKTKIILKQKQQAQKQKLLYYDENLQTKLNINEMKKMKNKIDDYQGNMEEQLEKLSDKLSALQPTKSGGADLIIDIKNSDKLDNITEDFTEPLQNLNEIIRTYEKGLEDNLKLFERIYNLLINSSKIIANIQIKTQDTIEEEVKKLQVKIIAIGDNSTRNIQLKMVKDISNTEFFEKNKNELKKFIDKLRQKINNNYTKNSLNINVRRERNAVLQPNANNPTTAAAAAAVAANNNPNQSNAKTQVNGQQPKNANQPQQDNDGKEFLKRILKTNKYPNRTNRYNKRLEAILSGILDNIDKKTVYENQVITEKTVRNLLGINDDINKDDEGFFEKLLKKPHLKALDAKCKQTNKCQTLFEDKDNMKEYLQEYAEIDNSEDGTVSFDELFYHTRIKGKIDNIEEENDRRKYINGQMDDIFDKFDIQDKKKEFRQLYGELYGYDTQIKNKNSIANSADLEEKMKNIYSVNFIIYLTMIAIEKTHTSKKGGNYKKVKSKKDVKKSKTKKVSYKSKVNQSGGFVRGGVLFPESFYESNIVQK